MIRLEINVDLLKSFVKKASLNGDITNINLDFKEDGLYSGVYDSSTVGLTLTKLSINAFTDYEAIGENTIRNTNMFLKMLNAFDGVINISKPEDYFLKLSQGRQKITVMLAARSVLSNIFDKDKPNIDFKVDGFFDSSDSKKVQKSISLLNEDKFTFSFKEDNLYFCVGDSELSDYLELEVPSFKGENNTSVTVGRLFPNFLKVIDNGFFLSFGDNTPIYLKEENELFTYEVFIAPIVD